MHEIPLNLLALHPSSLRARACALGVWNPNKLEWDQEKSFNFTGKHVAYSAKQEALNDWMRSARMSAVRTLSTSKTINHAIVSIDPRGENTYHWLCENLPDILQARFHAIKHDIKPSSIITSKSPRLAKEYLRLCGINEPIIESEDHHFALERPVIRSKHFYKQETHLSTNIRSVRQALDHTYRSIDEKIHQSQKIFIERREGSPNFPMARHRRIYPQAQLHAHLRKLGFEIIYLEDYSVTEQIKVCRNAKVISGMHGAGLTNIIHSRAETQLIEITHPNSTANHFKEIADHCKDVRYQRVALQSALPHAEAEKIVNETIYGWHNIPLALDTEVIDQYFN